MQYDTQEFIKRAKAAHGRLYDYSKTVYTKSINKVCIVCREHGDFWQTAANHLRGDKCPMCCTAHRLDTNSFIKLARKKHGFRYLYSEVVYKAGHSKVDIICRKHGVFKQTPAFHLLGNNCPTCANLLRGNPGFGRKTTESFIEQAKSVHGNRYDYTETVYDVGYLPIFIKCPEHGRFKQTPDRHLQPGGICPKCTSKDTSWSQKAIDWISKEANRRKMKGVQHSLNGKEYRIPGTRFKVDGFHEPSNTIFEFHGSRWHGDPVVYKPSQKPHPYSNKTSRQLYNATVQREDLFVQLGYRVIVIWEHDYNKGMRYSYIL